MQQWSVQCLVKMHEFWNTEDKEEGKEEEEEAWMGKDRHVILLPYFQESEQHTALAKI